MKNIFCFFLFIYTNLSMSNELAVYGEKLKFQYNSYPNMLLAQTGEKALGTNIKCQLTNINGALIPEAYFVMEAHGILKLYDGLKSLGFIYLEKYNEPIYIMKPIGNFENGKWMGDVFSSWENDAFEYTVYSERGGASGVANFDLIEGDGFYAKSISNSSPDYGLKDCRKNNIKNLPIYSFKR